MDFKAYNTIDQLSDKNNMAIDNIIHQNQWMSPLDMFIESNGRNVVC